uniref:Uncharacterized protein n=1 Tax=Ascaris lumbricoides TaxID=6252 RepID=A0A0M3HWR8_ASCLU
MCFAQKWPREVDSHKRDENDKGKCVQRVSPIGTQDEALRQDAFEFTSWPRLFRSITASRRSLVASSCTGRAQTAISICFNEKRSPAKQMYGMKRTHTQGDCLRRVCKSHPPAKHSWPIQAFIVFCG